MKIQCSQCGAKFHYEENYGICPKCQRYHPWPGTPKQPSGPSKRRFMRWLAVFLGAVVVFGGPPVYKTVKRATEVTREFKREVREELSGEQEQEIAEGERIRAGEYYITPGAAFWVPEENTLGLTSEYGRLLAVPVKVEENLDSPKEREVEYFAEIGEESIRMDFVTFNGDRYWPELDGYFQKYFYYDNERGEEEYLMFQIDGEPEAITLCVTEQVREPGSYEKIITRTYRTPVSIGEGREDDALLLHSRPDVKTQEPGSAFDYFNSRLNVRQVRCMNAAGDFEIPEGMKLVVAAVWREAEEWPHVSDIQSMTALIGKDHTVYPNITDWALKDEFEVDTGDLWQFYYKYNYESDKVNPDSILQFYVVPEDMEQAEMAFPVITSSDEAGNREEYWQLRVLLTLPDVNETREFD